MNMKPNEQTNEQTNNSYITQAIGQ